MKIGDCKRALLVEVGSGLSEFGFGAKPKQQSFYRPTASGWNCVNLAFIKHEDDFDVTASVSIRFDAVEDLVNSSNSLLSQKEKSGTSTLGVELGNLSIGEQRRWSVASENDIDPVAISILEAYKDFGEPYLARYSSMDAAYELLSSDDKINWKHCPFHATRAKKALAIAKILNRPDIESQISARARFLEEINDFGREDFLTFAKSLR